MSAFRDRQGNLWCITFDDATVTRVLAAARRIEKREITIEELRRICIGYARDGKEWEMATVIAFACRADPIRAGVSFIHEIADDRDVLLSALSAFDVAYLAKFGGVEAPYFRWLADVRTRRQKSPPTHAAFEKK